MSVVKILEIFSESDKSFKDAVQNGVAKASESVKNIRSAWVKEQKVEVEGSKVTKYRVLLKISFVVE